MLLAEMAKLLAEVMTEEIAEEMTEEIAELTERFPEVKILPVQHGDQESYLATAGARPSATCMAIAALWKQMARNW